MNPIQQIYNETEIHFETSAWQRMLFSRVTAPFAYDTETTGLDFGVPSYLYVDENTQIKVNNPTAFGIPLCLEYRDKLQLFWGRIGTDLFDAIVQFIQNPLRKVAHNARYDIRILRGQGIPIQGPFDCTLTMSRIINDNRMKHSLQSLVETLCPEMSDWEDEVKAVLKTIRARYTRRGFPPGYANYSFIPEEIIRKYGCIDVFMTYILYLKYLPIIRRTHEDVYRREIKIMLAAIDIENRGIFFDRRRAKAEIKRLNERCTKVIKRLQKYLGKGINPESYKQLLSGLRNFGITKRDLTYKGTASTRAEVLEKIAKGHNKKHAKVATLLLNLRSTRMLASRYLIPLTTRADYNNGIVYCSINSADTKTGRMSISKPSLQNIPRPDSGFEETNAVRRCFGPRIGYTWYFFDYSQIEMVYFCLLAGATKMVKAYMKGADIHTEMTKRVHGRVTPELRQETKSLNFGVIYGLGIRGLSEQLSVNITKADQIMSMYLERIPEIIDFREECQALVYQDGYVDCLLGKRYTAERTEAYKMVNKRIQGGTAQVLKVGVLQVLNDLRTRNWENARLVLPIHDELIFERPNRNYYPEEVFVRLVKRKMEEIPQLMKLGLKLRVDVSRTRTNWASKEKVKV